MEKKHTISIMSPSGYAESIGKSARWVQLKCNEISAAGKLSRKISWPGFPDKVQVDLMDNGRRFLITVIK